MLMENGKVSTEPVAGTRARTGSAAEILRNKLELLRSVFCHTFLTQKKARVLT